MKIIEQTHEIMAYNDIGKIEMAGRTCYQSQGKVGCTDKDLITRADCSWYGENDNCGMVECEKHSSHKFVKMLRNNDHEAMIEFGDIMVRFVTNRGVTHELVRHRHCSFAQESTRYVKYEKGDMEFILPDWVGEDLCREFGTSLESDLWLRKNLLMGRDPERIWIASCVQAEKNYKYLLKCGWKAQQAREILPNSLKTEIVVKANFREWRHILSLRCAKTSHPQMVTLMRPLLAELKTKIPVVFDDIT